MLQNEPVFTRIGVSTAENVCRKGLKTGTIRKAPMVIGSFGKGSKMRVRFPNDVKAEARSLAHDCVYHLQGIKRTGFRGFL